MVPVSGVFGRSHAHSASIPNAHDAPIAKVRQCEEVAAHAITSASPCRNAGLDRALAKSCADAKRSAGSFSRAFRMAPSTFGGIDTRTLVGAGAGSVRILARTA